MTPLPAPEVIAARLHAEAGSGRLPVDLMSIVRQWPGLRVSSVPIDGSGYLLRVAPGLGEILLRSADPAPRQRYTLAHELGHWVLGSYDVQGAPRWLIERWCDRFAAELLMPRKLLRVHLVRSRLAIDDIAHLHERFRVSERAMRLRVSEVAPIDLAVIELHERFRVVGCTARGGLGRLEQVDLRQVALKLRVDGSAVDCVTASTRIQAAAIAPRRYLVSAGSRDVIRRWLEGSRAPIAPGVQSRAVDVRREAQPAR